MRGMLAGMVRGRRVWRPRLAALTAVIVLLATVAAPRPAIACSLDGIASISLDGVLAVRTTDQPDASSLNRWAPFTFGLAYAPGNLLRFAEDRGKVARSLPPAAMTTPFRWDFGDGAAGDTARGFSVAHRYGRTGWYRVAVYSYWSSRHGWVLFDNVRVHILPAAQVGQANLGYQAVLGLLFLTKFVAYGGFALFFAIPIALRARRRRARSRRG